MKISGFSFVRNGIKLYYPIVESIKSILPICKEFVITVGESDEDDTTKEKILEINDPKIRIIDTRWDEQYFEKGKINPPLSFAKMQLAKNLPTHFFVLEIISIRCAVV